MDAARFRGHDELTVACPDCGTTLTLVSVRFPGMPILVDAHCSGCGREFWLDWPAGHALLHPVIVEVETGVVHFDGREWYARRLLDFLASREQPVPARIGVRGGVQRSSEAILVDCIDFLYGHCLLKLLSAPRHQRESPRADVIVIAPKLLSWLIPAGTRVIEVDVPLQRGGEWIDGLDEAVEEVLSPYETVRISPTVSQPEVNDLDLAALAPDVTASPFWGAPPDTRPQVGLIIRDDRLWLGNRSLLLGAARRVLPRRMMNRLLDRRQSKLFGEVARRVWSERPEVRVVAVGIGRAGGLPGGIEDLRTMTPTLEDEHAWLGEYSKSRVIVGVHGSNMLLPSALAGATVDLLPRHKLAEIGQDLIIAGTSEHEPKLCLFRYRIFPDTTSPGPIAETVLSILEHANYHHRNMIENRAAYGTVGWPRPVSWRQLSI